MVNLEVLLLKNCHKLGSLPESISGLKALKVLDLSSDAREHGSWGSIIPMSIRSLPEGFEKLVNLERESFMACIKQVQYLPESIVEHPHLRDATELDLSQAKLVALPERIGQLVNLKTLNLSKCPAERTMPPAMKNSPPYTR